MESNIFMEGIEFYAFHGYSEQERTVGNLFYVDLMVSLDLTRASESDNLEDTVNYAQIYDTVKKEMKIKSSLLEHVAGRIMKAMFQNFPTIDKIHLKVIKQTPPMGGNIKNIGVSFSSDRDTFKFL